MFQVGKNKVHTVIFFLKKHYFADINTCSSYKSYRGDS